MPEIFEAIAIAQVARLPREVAHRGVVAVLVEQKRKVVLQLSRFADSGTLSLCFLMRSNETVPNLVDTNRPSSDFGSIPCHEAAKALFDCFRTVVADIFQPSSFGVCQWFQAFFLGSANVPVKDIDRSRNSNALLTNHVQKVKDAWPCLNQRTQMGGCGEGGSFPESKSSEA